MICRRLALTSVLALIACGASSAPAPAPALASASSASASPTSEDRPAPRPAPVSRLDPCDEVACVLDNYEDPCCRKFKRPRRGRAAPASGAADRLTPEMIREALAPLRAAIAACGDDSSAGHRVKLRVQVQPDGSSDVSIDSTGDPRLADCVADVVRTATYPATQAGGSFTQPYIF